jgi:hypothetical protein
MPLRLSRRQFLKLGGAAALAGTARGLGSPSPVAASSHLGLGRVTRAIEVFAEPSFAARVERLYYSNAVLGLLEKAVGDPPKSHNRTWFRTEDGWVHSAQIQPVRNELNDPVLDIPPTGFLAEVTVPVTDAWHDGDSATHRAYEFYYATTHWVDQLVTDRQGVAWYRVLDDRYQVYYFVEAAHLRRIPADELTPLEPEAGQKRIEISLARQRLTAYVNARRVFSARIATGRAGVETPSGVFKVERKRPSRHMAANDGGGNGFDLPGVPWVSYFYWTGVALHGTYWHNDYGAPRSRGCVNLTPDDAKWLYRWTMPLVASDEQTVRDENGTQVLVLD